MIPRALRLVALQICLAAMRIGWINGLICLVYMVGALGWLWALPDWREQLAARQFALAQAQQQLRLPRAAHTMAPRTPAEERLARFYDVLGDQRNTEQQIKMLFTIAKKNNLILSQAEYRWSSNKHGRYHSYQILLPVKGSYGAIRRFCAQTLLAIPFASLDEMHFKREAIGNHTVEARLRFSLYLREAPPPMLQATALAARGLQ